MNAQLKRLLQGSIFLHITYSLFVIVVADNGVTPSINVTVHSKPAVLSNPRYGEHKFITVNGVRLHCVIKGAADKPLMLLVHGFPEFWYVWRHQIDEFSRDYRTVAFDLRGYGDSDKPAGLAPYRIERLVADLRQLILALGYTHCTLVCHDWGANIGWHFLQSHMQMVDRYVMMSGPSTQTWLKTIETDPTQLTKSWYFFWYQVPAVPESTLAANDFAQLRTVWATQSGDDLAAYLYTFSQPGALTPPINYYRANFQSFFDATQERKLCRYAPGLFMLGADDAFLSTSLGPTQQQQFDNLQFVVVPGANHFFQQDAPEVTNALMRKFLSA